MQVTQEQVAVISAFKQLNMLEKQAVQALDNELDKQYALIHKYCPQLTVSQFVTAMDDIMMELAVMYTSELVEELC